MSPTLLLAVAFATIIVGGTLAALIHDRLTGHRGPGTLQATPRRIPRLRLPTERTP